jgi:hypothetical protein
LIDGGAATQLPNKTGINTTATVAKMVKTGQPQWAGSKLKYGFPVDFRLKVIKLRVWSPAAGKKTIIKI